MPLSPYYRCAQTKPRPNGPKHCHLHVDAEKERPLQSAQQYKGHSFGQVLPLTSSTYWLRWLPLKDAIMVLGKLHYYLNIFVYKLSEYDIIRNIRRIRLSMTLFDSHSISFTIENTIAYLRRMFQRLQHLHSYMIIKLVCKRAMKCNSTYVCRLEVHCDPVRLLNRDIWKM